MGEGSATPSAIFPVLPCWCCLPAVHRRDGTFPALPNAHWLAGAGGEGTRRAIPEMGASDVIKHIKDALASAHPGAVDDE